jgi:hypothetical protein
MEVLPPRTNPYHTTSQSRNPTVSLEAKSTCIRYTNCRVRASLLLFFDHHTTSSQRGSTSPRFAPSRCLETPSITIRQVDNHNCPVALSLPQDPVCISRAPRYSISEYPKLRASKLDLKTCLSNWMISRTWQHSLYTTIVPGNTTLN